MKLAYAPLKCAPGECYAYQNVAFSLIGDVVFAATGQFFEQDRGASHLQAARHAMTRATAWPASRPAHAGRARTCAAATAGCR
jgi:hypothetical protein